MSSTMQTFAQMKLISSWNVSGRYSAIYDKKLPSKAVACGFSFRWLVETLAVDTLAIRVTMFTLINCIVHSLKLLSNFYKGV